MNYEPIKEYYGSVLKTNKDLKTSACCPGQALPDYLISLSKKIHPEILERFYGCGAPFPPALTGKTVLDLGCGAGRDCYVLSHVVGEKGKVIGIDMLPSQLEVARRFEDFHRKAFGYLDSNVSFLEGYIEDLEGAGIPTESVDVVISNCVLNLSPEKDRVFKEIFRVLKPGAEFFFSDVFCDRRIPKALAQDTLFLVECLGGAFYFEDFRRHLLDVGVPDFRMLSKSHIELSEPLKSKAGNIRFSSVTVRAFKLRELEDRCEDYGQTAIYKGSVQNHAHGFLLDDHHFFETGRPVPVCRNTALMLSQTRFSEHFEISGEGLTHFGLFDCGPTKEIPSGCC